MLGSIWRVVRLIAEPLISIYLIPKLLKDVVVTGTDQRRYDLIAGIALEIANDLVQRYPDHEFDDLLWDIIAQVRAGVPTSNEEVIYRAAANATRAAYRTYRQEAPPEG